MKRHFILCCLGLLVCSVLFLQWQKPMQPNLIQPSPTPKPTTPVGSAAAWMEQGIAALKSDKMGLSDTCFANAKALYSKQNDWEGLAKASYYLSRLDNRNAHLEFDTLELDRAFAIAEKHLPTPNYWRGKIWIGKGIHLFWKTPHIDSSELYFNKAKAMYLEMQEWESVVECSFYLARIYGKRDGKERQWDELQYTYATMREHVPQINFWTGEVLYFIASRYLNKLDSTVAKDYLLEAKLIHKEIKEWNSYLKTCNYLAEYCLERQQFAEMKSHLDEAAECVRQNPAWERRMQEIYQYYGKYYNRIGDYENALINYEKVFDFVITDSLYLAYHFYSMGNMLLEQNDLERANDYLQNALYNAKRHEQKELYPILQTLFGTIAEKQSGVLSAIQAHRIALKEAKQLIRSGNDDYNEGLKSMIKSNLSLARIFLQADLPDSCILYLQQNQEIHKSYPYLDYSTYGLLGQWFVRKKDYPQALASLQDALERCRKIYGNHHFNIAELYYEMGEVYQKLGQYDESLNQYQRGLQALDADYDITKLEKNPSTQKVTALNSLRKLLVAKAEILELKGFTSLAYESVQEALKAIEQLQTSFKTEGSKLFAQQQAIPTYELAVQLAWRLHDSTAQPQYLEHAFRYAEQNKSLLLLDALKNNEAEQFGGIPDSLQKRENDLMRTLSFYQQQLTESQRTKDTIRQKTAQMKILEYKTDIKKLQQYLEENFPKYYEAKYAPRLASTAQIQQRLPQKALLLEYFVGSDAVYAFSISKEHILFKKLVKSKHFGKQISHFYNGVSDVKTAEKELQVQFNEYVQSADLLYEQMVQPLLQTNVNRLFIVPDGELNYVAFDALLTQTVPPDKPQFKKLPYLIRDYAIHYHYSASLWANNRQSGRNRGKVLAMAATYDSTDWQKTKSVREQTLRRDLGDIPGAKVEVEKLSLNFQGAFLTGEPANERNFRELAASGDYSVIHLAMHGLVDRRHSNNSGLVFTKTADTLNDDIVHSYELNLMELNADMVVLSACETGYGKYERGEGVLSLGRSFMYAGIPSLVSTFWPLNDQTSPIIIANFYKQLGTQIPKDRALREAKVQYLERAEGVSAHPFFWASFATVGDEDELVLAYTVPVWMYVWIVFCFAAFAFVSWKYGRP